MAKVFILGEDDAGGGERNCQCRAKQGNLKCQCYQSKYFLPGKAPAKYICSDCTGGTHNFSGLGS